MNAADTTTFGRYRALREIGRGGEATVHLAEDPALGRHVAVKIFPPAIGADAAELPASFRREVDALSRLRHPGICAIHDAGVQDGCAYIVMSFVEGRALGSNGAPTPLDAARLVEDAARAVAAAHAAGIVHGDLKPANLLVTKERRCVVLDFGVARFLADPEGNRSPGRFAGTLPYLAPECLNRPPDTRSDVFALGAVLFELVSGRTPFNAPTRAALIARMKHEDPPLLRSVVRDAPRDLEAVLARALDRSPERRYATVDAFADELSRLCAGERVMARRYGPLARATRWASRHRASAGLGIFAIVFLAVSAVVAAIKNGEFRDNVIRAAAAAKRATDTALAARLDVERAEWLADRQRVMELEASVARLDRPSPAIEPELRAWLAAADALVRQLEVHRDALQQIRSRGRAVSRPAAMTTEQAQRIREINSLRSRLAGLPTQPAVSNQKSADANLRTMIERIEASIPPLVDAVAYDSVHDTWEDRVLSAIVAGLDRLVDPDPVRGLIAASTRRLDQIRRLEEVAATSADAWEQARRSIADADACPRYGGLTIRPQFGLSPLRRDPDSGLWEFLVALSGEPPALDGSARYDIRAETGIVLVLVPGGRGHMGSRRPGPGDPPIGPNLDSNATPDEAPLDRVSLEPFFLSKFEMTRAQWTRATGVAAAPTDRGTRGTEARATATLPMTGMDWNEASAVMASLGLDLPTEAQWEYAARAGTATPWWTGETAATLDGAAVFSARALAPIGGRRPNAFGLHDVAGNVSEWCQDVFARYDDPRTPGTGERAGLDEAEHRIRRGGGFPNDATELRSARRRIESPAAHLSETGVRPARRLDE